MSARFTWSPEFEQLKQDIKTLPGALAGEGAKIVEGHANGAVVSIKSGYPVISGNLRDKVQVTHTRPPFAAKSVVKNTAKYATAFEKGSQVRHYITVNGKTKTIGKMPATPLFSREMARARRAKDQDVIAMLQRHGLTVTGEA